MTVYETTRRNPEIRKRLTVETSHDPDLKMHRIRGELTKNADKETETMHDSTDSSEGTHKLRKVPSGLSLALMSCDLSPDCISSPSIISREKSVGTPPLSKPLVGDDTFLTPFTIC